MNNDIYDVSQPDCDGGDIAPEVAADLAALFALAVQDEPESAMTPLTVVAAARAEQRARRIRQWGGGLVAAAAVVGAVLVVPHVVTGGGSDMADTAYSAAMPQDSDSASSFDEDSAHEIYREADEDGSAPAPAADMAGEAASGADASDDSADEATSDGSADSNADAEAPAGAARDTALAPLEITTCATHNLPPLPATAAEVIPDLLGADLQRAPLTTASCIAEPTSGASYISSTDGAHVTALLMTADTLTADELANGDIRTFARDTGLLIVARDGDQLASLTVDEHGAQRWSEPELENAVRVLLAVRDEVG